MITIPAKNGMPSQTRLTKKSNGTRLAARRQQDQPRTARPAPAASWRGWRRAPRPGTCPAWPAGRRRCSQPARAGVLLGEDRALDRARRCPRQRVLEPADVAVRSRARGARRGHRRRRRRVGRGAGSPAAAVAGRSDAPGQPVDQRRRTAGCPSDPADLVADGGVPQRRVGVAEERQGQVVVRQRRAEDAGQVAAGPAARSRTRPCTSSALPSP